MHYLNLSLRSREILLSAPYIRLPMHLHSLKLLRQKVKEDIHLQENTFDLWGQDQTNVA